MDANIEEMLTKISAVEKNITYYQEQATAADTEFKDVLSAKTAYENNGHSAEWQRQREMAESALKDTNANLNSEKRMLKFLKSKLENGDFDMSSKSSTGKRKFDSGDNLTSESSSSKR